MNNKAHLRPKDYDSNGDIIPMSMEEEKGDLISREALRKAFHGRIYYFDKSSWDEANALIDNAPTVNPDIDFAKECYAVGYEDGKSERPQSYIRWTDKLSITSSGDIIDFEGRVVGHIKLEDMKGGAE